MMNLELFAVECTLYPSLTYSPKFTMLEFSSQFQIMTVMNKINNRFYFIVIQENINTKP